MMKRYWFGAAALVLGGCLLAALSSQAADKDKAAPAEKDKATVADKDDPDIKSSPEADAVAEISAAYKLADWGRRMDPPSPFALISAAEVLKRTVLQPGTESKDLISAPEGSQKADTGLLQEDAKQLLAEAVKMAKENKLDVATVQAMAADVGKVPTTRGGLNGPLMFTMRLRPGQTDTYNIKFKRGEWARISVRQPDDNIVDLHAIDANGHDRAADWARNPVVSFMVRQGDGTDYRVTVRNARGRDAITYQLFTN